MAGEHYILIGNGPAANQAAIILREKAPDARVTMIGRERVPHYKPHLLPHFIAGKISEDELFVNPLNYYKDQGITLRLGQNVVGVDLTERKVILEHKEALPYDGLIIATGGRPRIPEPLERFAEFMLTLKTLEDARTWIDRLAQVDSVLLIGGDLTSLSLTKALLALGKKVSFILCEDSFWPLRFSDELQAEVSKRLAARGVRVLGCPTIRRIERTAATALAVETDQEKLSVGLIGAFYGLVPDVGFLARSGLDMERGLLVNEYLETRFDGVYAAGDCAQVFHPELRDYWVSIGFGNAGHLGRIAALNLVGSRVRADVSPQSIFRLGDINVNVSWWMEF
jgi:NAD(P)H-nitrite reductase large subunit